MNTPAFLKPADTNHPEPCRDSICHEAVKQNPDTGRWFITMGHPGFNNPANNAAGYKTQLGAIRATQRRA